MGVIDELKQKVDILEIIGQYVQLTKSGRTYRAPCPFHSEKKPSFFVYPEQQTWHCFGACNTGGDIFSFVMKKEGLDFKDTLVMLAEKYGVVIPSKTRSEAEDSARDKILQINLMASQYYNNLFLNNPAAEKARNYLQKRGVNEKAIVDFQIGYSLPAWEALKSYLLEKGFSEEDILSAGLILKSEKSGNVHDRFRDHIMFPIMNDKGHINGFGARVLDDSSPKYINSPQTRVFDKSGSLYGIHLAKAAIKKQDLAVLVEGYMDVIIAHQYGFSNVIAPMGVAITDKQINQIKKLTRNISLALDPDAAGEDAALRCINYENQLDAEIRVITLPDGKDPDEVIKEDINIWKNHVEKSVPVIDYAIKIITAKLDLKTSNGKSAAVSKLLPIISEVKNGTRQDDYLTKLAKLSGTTKLNLESALKTIKPNQRSKFTNTEEIKRATKPIRSNPVEEYLLTILLNHPEMRPKVQDLMIDYFENSENRSVFEIWRSCDNPADINNIIDDVFKEHLESLFNKQVTDDNAEEKYLDCLLRLKERYLRNLKYKQEEALTLAAESGDKTAVMAKLQEQGNEINEELAKIFTLRAKTHGVTKK